MKFALRLNLGLKVLFHKCIVLYDNILRNQLDLPKWVCGVLPFPNGYVEFYFGYIWVASQLTLLITCNNTKQKG